MYICNRIVYTLCDCWSYEYVHYIFTVVWDVALDYFVVKIMALKWLTDTVQFKRTT